MTREVDERGAMVAARERQLLLREQELEAHRLGNHRNVEHVHVNARMSIKNPEWPKFSGGMGEDASRFLLKVRSE